MQKISCLFEFTSLLLPTDLSKPAYRPSAKTELSSRNLAGTFSCSPEVAENAKVTVYEEFWMGSKYQVDVIYESSLARSVLHLGGVGAEAADLQPQRANLATEPVTLGLLRRVLLPLRFGVRC